jgi:hypothetical protein
MWPYPSSPYRIGGSVGVDGGSGWGNCWGCNENIDGTGGLCAGGCNLSCVELPAPIANVLEVVIDGVLLPESAYRVEAYRRVCRVDGHGWPCSNNLRGVSCVTTNTVVEVAVDATGGDWDVTVQRGTSTDTFVFDATDAAAVVEAAMNAVLGAGAVTVAGGPGNAGATSPYVIELDVTVLAAVPTVTVGDVSLTGGAETVTLDVTEAGCLADAGTWHITYEFGKPPPSGGRLAASILACQIALNRCGGDGCVLPQRLQDVTREGVSMTFADPLDFLQRGEVGIYEVDLWLNSVNPKKIQRRASVYRADAGRPPTSFT